MMVLWMTSVHLVSYSIHRGSHVVWIITTVQINPDVAHAYFNRANLYKSYQKYSLAEEDYKTG